MSTKITYTIAVLLVITGVCVGIAKGMSGLEESMKARNDSISQAVALLGK